MLSQRLAHQSKLFAERGEEELRTKKLRPTACLLQLSISSNLCLRNVNKPIDHNSNRTAEYHKMAIATNFVWSGGHSLVALSFEAGFCRKMQIVFCHMQESQTPILKSDSVRLPMCPNTNEMPEGPVCLFRNHVDNTRTEREAERTKKRQNRFADIRAKTRKGRTKRK